MGEVPLAGDGVDLETGARTDEQIAASLGISYWTVRSHLRKVFIKFDVANRIELTRALVTLN